MAKALSLGTWFLLGAFLIQIRGHQQDDPRISSLADGREVTLTAHVIREGYPQAADRNRFVNPLMWRQKG